MGWGRFLLLGNLGQQLDISDQRNEIEDLKEELRRSRISSPAASSDIARLQAENDELRLYLAALVRLLTAKGLVSREEIRQVVNTVDAEDGTRDGRYQGDVA
jgi:multidrug resistance efflux pump